MKHVLPVFFLLFSLGGCASEVPLVIREPPPDNPGVSDVQMRPAAFVNRPVRWGGTIVSARSMENGTEVEILAKVIRSDGRPEPGDVTLGRFLVKSGAFLDPAVYSADREVTVYGVLQNITVRNIGAHPYSYPVVQATQLHLWTDPREVGDDDWWPQLHFGIGFGFGVD